jgi:exodeoxyribonuclease V gamma subunit
MIRLVYSNRTESLLGALAQRLAEAPADPLAAVFGATTVVVPNRNVETYLKLGLARERGIVANLDCVFLKGFVATAFERAAGDRELLEGARLHAAVLDRLSDEALLRHPELGPARDYVFGDGGSPDAAHLRRFQLARELAHLFEEYAYSREEMLTAWRRGGLVTDGRWRHTERWQRRLWLAVFDPARRRTRAPGEPARAAVPLHELLADLPASLGELPPRVHVFGISYVARLFLRVFAALGARTELCLYVLNPCQEFWEDVPSESARRARLPRRASRLDPAVLSGSDDPFGLLGATGDAAPDNAALRLWGRPGRENVRLLNELTGCDFEAPFADPLAGGDSLLRRLQRAVLDREAERAPGDPVPPPRPPDGSVVFLPCPGVRREAEAIAERIWKLVREDQASPRPGRAPLRFDDIAVMVAGPDADRYFTHLSAAFREAHDLPHSMSDLRFGAGSRVAEALSRLLALPDSRFRREDVLGVALHPAVLSRWPDADPARWVRLVDALGIVFGRDSADLRSTYVTGDLLSWDQGLRRLALGAFLATPEPFVVGEDRYLPLERTAGTDEDALRLGLLVRSLLADARFAADARLSFADWSRFLVGLARTYLVPAGESDERDLETCVRALESLADLEAGETTVPWRIAAEFARGALDGLGGRRGHYLADGVVLSTLRPMRAIPFKVVFIAGLDEGAFPAADRRSQLDLRLVKRRAGDVLPREQDRYLFLETVLSARDRLFLSWVGRDERTGEPLEPSLLVTELRRLLEQSLLPPGGTGNLSESVPLRRFDGAAGSAFPEARREAGLVALRRHLESHLGGVDPPAPARLVAAVDEALREPLRRSLGLLAPPAGRTRLAGEGPLRLPLGTLRRFLECPLQGHARLLLGLDDDAEEDLVAVEDERFATPAIERSGLLKGAFLDALRTGRRPEAAYDATVDRLRLEGRAPLGLFGAAEREKHLKLLESWAVGLAAEAPSSLLRTLRFGPDLGTSAADDVYPPLVLDLALHGRALRVELTGRPDPQLVALPGSLLLATSQGRLARELLRGWLDGLVLAAAGLSAGEHHLLFLSDEGPTHRRFALPAPAAARALLTGLATELLGRVHAYLLPYETVVEWHAGGRKGRLENAIDRARCSHFPSISSRYGPVPNPLDYPPPPEEEAVALAERRFAAHWAALPPDAGQRSRKEDA